MMEEELIRVLLSTHNDISDSENKLKELRKSRKHTLTILRGKGVTARRLSDLLGISEQSIHKIVKGTK